MRKLTLFGIILTLVSGGLLAQTTVAVVEASIPKSWDPAVGEVLGEKISEALLKVKGFKVLDRANLKKVLKEKELAATGLINDQEAQAMAQLLGAKFIVVPRGAKLGKTFYFAARMLNSSTGEVAAQVTIEGQGDWEQVPGLAEKLGSKLGDFFGLALTNGTPGTTQVPASKLHNIQVLQDKTPVTLTWKLPLAYPHYDKLIARFRQVNPGVTIKMETYAVTDGEISKKILQDKNSADLVSIPGDKIPEWALSGTVKDTTAFLQRVPLRPLAKDIVSYQGKTWGIPLHQGNHLFLAYNKKLTGKEISSWEELLKTTYQGKNAVAFCPPIGYFSLSMLLGYGLKLPQDLQGQGLIQRAPVQKYLEGLIQNPGIAQVKGKDAWKIFEADRALFLKGQLPYLITGDWDLELLSASLKENLALAPLPVVQATGLPMRPLTSGYALLGRTGVTKQKELAIEAFLDFMISEEAQKEMMIWSRQLPSLNTPGLQQAEDSDDLLKQLRKTLTHGYPVPMHVQAGKLWKALDKRLWEGLNTLTPERAAKLLEEDLAQGL